MSKESQFSYAKMVDDSVLGFLKKILFSGLVAYVVFVLIKRFSAKKKAVKDRANEVVDDAKAPFLERSQKKPIKLVNRVDLSHDSAVLHFELDRSDRVLGLPVGKHFKLVMPNLKGVVSGEWNGRPDAEYEKTEVTRSYTPISGDEHLGKLDLLIKFYKPGVKDRFPDGGKVSRQLDDLKIGDSIYIQGPYGRVEYQGPGTFKVGRKVLSVKNVGMMAGGSGITPILQVARYALNDAKDQTKFWLIYANQTEGDILVREELEKFAKDFPDRFKLHYTLDRPEESWKYSTGFITADMIKQYLPPPSDETLILMCGPPPMIKFACRQNLDTLGYPKDSQVEF